MTCAGGGTTLIVFVMAPPSLIVPLSALNSTRSLSHDPAPIGGFAPWAQPLLLGVHAMRSAPFALFSLAALTLLACGGKLADSEELAARTTAKVPVRKPTRVSDDEAPAPVFPPAVAEPLAPAPAGDETYLRTDLADPEAAIICTQRAQRGPRGAFTQEPNHWRDVPLDVTAHVAEEAVVDGGRTRVRISLSLDLASPPERSIDASGGRVRTDPGFMYSFDFVADGPLAPGTYNAVQTFGVGCSAICAADGSNSVGCSGSGPWPPGNLVITSRTSTEIEGHWEEYGEYVTPNRSTFRAVFPIAEPKVCCLK